MRALVGSWRNSSGNDALAVAEPQAAGTGAVQVYDPSEPTKPSKGAISPASSRNTSFDHERALARKDNLALCCKMFVFFVYLLLFTVGMLYEQGKSPARLADHIQATLDGGPVPLVQVVSTARLYDYMQYSFVPAVFGQTIDRTLASQLSPTLVPFDFSNRLLGTVRVRQARVARQPDCQVSPMFKAYTVSCFPAYGSDTETNATFGTGYTFSEDDDGTAFRGEFATYGPHGFMQLLPTDAYQASMAVAAMRQGQFLDSATRAVFLEFSLWSSNVATYAAVSVAVEFGATGAASRKVSVLTLTEGVLSPGGHVFAFLLVIVVLLFNFYFIGEELAEIWVKRLKYFFDAWNILDWINMILLLAAFVLRIINFAEASSANIGGQALANNMTYSSLRGIAYRAHLVNLIHAVNGALLWGKAIKYFRFLPLVKNIIHIVWNAFDLFLPFICMFTVAFIGFAMAYNIGFGDKIGELSTFYMSAVYLARAFLRDINLMTVYDLATPMFAATLILLYYVTLLLVGASFLFAIIADALFRAKFRAEDKPNPYHWNEPCEEFVRLLDEKFGLLGKLAGLRRGILWLGNCGCLRRGPQQEVDGQDAAKGGGPGGDPPVGKDDLFGFDTSSISGASRTRQLALPSRTNMMRAVELMSGRILSEMAIVGIEIRSELHEVCERVAQMQMAVEELADRADKVQREQLVDLH